MDRPVILRLHVFSILQREAFPSLIGCSARGSIPEGAASRQREHRRSRRSRRPTLLAPALKVSTEWPEEAMGASIVI